MKSHPGRFVFLVLLAGCAKPASYFQPWPPPNQNQYGSSYIAPKLNSPQWTPAQNKIVEGIARASVPNNVPAAPKLTVAATTGSCTIFVNAYWRSGNSWVLAYDKGQSSISINPSNQWVTQVFWDIANYDPRRHAVQWTSIPIGTEPDESKFISAHVNAANQPSDGDVGKGQAHSQMLTPPSVSIDVVGRIHVLDGSGPDIPCQAARVNYTPPPPNANPAPGEAHPPVGGSCTILVNAYWNDGTNWVLAFGQGQTAIAINPANRWVTQIYWNVTNYNPGYVSVEWTSVPVGGAPGAFVSAQMNTANQPSDGQVSQGQAHSVIMSPPSTSIDMVGRIRTTDGSNTVIPCQSARVNYYP